MRRDFPDVSVKLYETRLRAVISCALYIYEVNH